MGLLLFTYSAVPDGPGDEFACRGVDADGAGAVDCVVCYDCLGEDIWEMGDRSLWSACVFYDVYGGPIGKRCSMWLWVRRDGL